MEKATEIENRKKCNTQREIYAVRWEVREIRRKMGSEINTVRGEERESEGR